MTTVPPWTTTVRGMGGLLKGKDGKAAGRQRRQGGKDDESVDGAHGRASVLDR